MKPHNRHSRAVAAGVLVASVLSVAACGSSSSPQQKVPTLHASGSAAASASAKTPSADAESGRPRERLDMTEAERDALDRQYTQCLADNGFDKTKNPRDASARTKAQNACVSKDPLPPWELDVNNPHSADFVHAVVKCLRAKGVRYVSQAPPENGMAVFSFGGPNNDPESISKGLKYTPECEKQAAAQGAGH